MTSQAGNCFFSIANHLEFLTKRWSKPEEISVYWQLYERCARECKIWADAKESHATSTTNAYDDLSYSSS